MHPSPPSKSATVLLVGNFRPSLAIARSLTRAGHRVVYALDGFKAAARSRYVAETWNPRQPDGPAGGYLEALRSFVLSREDRPLIYPISQNAIVHLLPHLEELPTTVVMSNPEAFKISATKGRMFDLASELGVPTAPYAIVSDRDALIAEAGRIGYPCVAKWTDMVERRSRVFIFGNEAQLRRSLPRWPDWLDSLLIQRYVTGLRYNRYFIAERGTILQSLDVKTLRTDQADGTGVSVEGISIEPLRSLDEPCKRLIERLNYTGIGNVQFLIDDESGATSFLEIDPRLGGNYAFIDDCGLDQASALVDLARGLSWSGKDDGLAAAVGKRYAWTVGDITGLAVSVRARRVGLSVAFTWMFRALSAALRADSHLTWSWRDPLPSLHLLYRTVRSLGAGFVRVVARRLLRHTR